MDKYSSKGPFGPIFHLGPNFTRFWAKRPWQRHFFLFYTKSERNMHLVAICKSITTEEILLGSVYENY